MTLDDLTPNQLWRVYARLYPTGYGTWDWPTLRLTYPSRWLAMRSVLAAIRRRSVCPICGSDKHRDEHSMAGCKTCTPPPAGGW